MKKLFAILFLASALVVFSHGLGKVAAGEDESATPASALRGNYADALHGSFALCLAPVSPFAEESCSTKGALVFPQSIVTAGHVTNGKNGSCETGTETVSDFPVDLSPPFVTVFQTVGKSHNYDRNTGTGDASFTTYVGGKCNGAEFDSTGATIISTGNTHFVASDNGKRIEGVVTVLTDPTNGIGDFSESFVELKQ